MDKLKNFFYNKNDIIVALLIIIVAAIVIYVCMRSILGYPERMIENMTSDIGYVLSFFSNGLNL